MQNVRGKPDFIPRRTGVSNIYHYFTAIASLSGLKQRFTISYDSKGWPDTPGQFFHDMFAGVTHEFSWDSNIQDGS